MIEILEFGKLISNAGQSDRRIKITLGTHYLTISCDESPGSRPSLPALSICLPGANAKAIGMAILAMAEEEESRKSEICKAIAREI